MKFILCVCICVCVWTHSYKCWLSHKCWLCLECQYNCSRYCTSVVDYNILFLLNYDYWENFPFSIRIKDGCIVFWVTESTGETLYLFIPSFNNYLLNIYYVPDSWPNVRDTVINKTLTILEQELCPMGKIDLNGKLFSKLQRYKNSDMIAHILYEQEVLTMSEE